MQLEECGVEEKKAVVVGGKGQSGFLVAGNWGSEKLRPDASTCFRARPAPPEDGVLHKLYTMCSGVGTSHIRVHLLERLNILRSVLLWCDT